MSKGLISGECIWMKCWIRYRQAQEYLEAKMHRPMKKAFIIFLLIPIFTACNSENKRDTVNDTGKIQTIFPQNQDQADTVNDAEAGERKPQGNDAAPTDARTIGAVAVSAYEQHEPILIENIQATVDDPYIVEGYEISSDEANCIEIRNSKNIIIRGNYLHDCTFYTDEYPGGWQEGHSIYAENSENITIEDNLVEDNIMGPYVRHSNSVKIMNNSVYRSVYQSAIRCDNCNDVEIAYNYLEDNGIPEWFWTPGIRLIGIWIMSTDNADIHDNTVIRSSSDGISVCGNDYMENDWTIVSRNVNIHNNIILDNLEQGIWASRVINLHIYSNTIRTTCFQQRNGIFFEFDVNDSEIFDNKIATCRGSTIGFRTSHDNKAYNNSQYSAQQEPFGGDSDEADGPQKAKDSGIPYAPSSGNEINNNVQYLLTGKLAEVMQEKLDTSEILKTYVRKGLMSCNEDGVVDLECVERERNGNDIGVPSEILGYSPLMYNFDDYILEEYIFAEYGDTECLECEVCNYLPEKIYSALFFTTLALLFTMIFLYSKKK